MWYMVHEPVHIVHIGTCSWSSDMQGSKHLLNAAYPLDSVIYRLSNDDIVTYCHQPALQYIKFKTGLVDRWAKV